MQTNLVGSFFPATNHSVARNELIAECMQDALNDGDGRPRPNALAHHLAKHGLVIVEASKYEIARTALQLIASYPDITAIVKSAASTALKKMES